MIYVGIDVHKEFLQVAAVDEDGTLLLNERTGTDHAGVRKFFSQFPRDRTRCVMESSSVWYGLFRCMADTLKMDMTLSNPYQTKAIAASKKKTYRIDARILTDLHRGGYIAQCYVAGAGTVESRQLARYRHARVTSRTRYKNIIHGMLPQNGTRIPGATFTGAYVDALRDLKDYRTGGYLEETGSHDRQIAAADVMVRKRAAESGDAMLPMPVPGGGRYTALTVSAGTGDVSGSADSHGPCPHAGTVPSVRNSAGVVHHGRITKRGSRMPGRILTEAVHSHARYAPDSR